MNSDLVTLSACQTGLGRFIRGEGIEGLSRAFFYAGASSVLMSLWTVNDEATYQLMERFYYHLRSAETLSDSLQEAKIELIESGVLSHPYYWAGFILTGRTDKAVFPKKSYQWLLLASPLCAGLMIFIAVKRRRKKNHNHLEQRES
jgi:CHAT domain-containing protein